MSRLEARPSPGFGGDADLPGDKSISHRALILSAMADGTSRITGLLEAEDVRATRAAVEAFGATIVEDGPDLLVTGGPWRSPGAPIDCGNSGTSARLLMGAAAGCEGLEARFVGDESLSRRPMARVTTPLSRMGARFEGGDTLPLTLHGAALGGIDYESPVASAQVKSAILLAGLRTDAPVRVIEPAPSRDHSEVMLAQFGVEGAAETVGEGVAVSLGSQRRLTATDVAVPGDPSSAAFLWAAAAMIEGARVTTHATLVNATRTGFLEALEAMGADVQLSNPRVQSGEPVADVTVAHRRLEPLHLEAARVPSLIDEVPILACVAAMADGESVFEGIGDLKHKESDRIGSTAAGLVANGVSVFPDADRLTILGRGRVAGGGEVICHHDHRIAMAFLTLGLAARAAIRIDDAGPIATSFPSFVAIMRSLGADIGEPQ
ncbi:3-phosphoshikimate 1-carboxyvinyltransferase [Sphingomicrobium sp. XHP0235]|uniref:3-phosphoshikimate 1-carboxyvinyltransferase n=1 Tax=Sphingomicrobium aquimarinum TaxID=3133971 RepID=UPI0031FF3CD1